MITLSESADLETPISNEIIMYLNRLSDWLFVVSRDVNRVLGHTDQPWDQASLGE